MSLSFSSIVSIIRGVWPLIRSVHVHRTMTTHNISQMLLFLTAAVTFCTIRSHSQFCHVAFNFLYTVKVTIGVSAHPGYSHKLLKVRTLFLQMPEASLTITYKTRNIFIHYFLFLYWCIFHLSGDS